MNTMLLMSLPFFGLLLCIAVLPNLPWTKKLWHHNWFQLLVSLCFGLPVGIWCLTKGFTSQVGHSIEEYVQLVLLLSCLYGVTGGLRVAGDIRATPGNNLAFMIVGVLIASWVGTAGASMLLFPALMSSNQQRMKKVHTVIFFILTVANCGGLLSPNGDPPLYMGYMRGIPFSWPMTLWPAWLYVNGLLLMTYFAVDRWMYAREKRADVLRDDEEAEVIRVRGISMLVALGGVVASVIFLPSPLREIGMLTSLLASYIMDKRRWWDYPAKDDRTGTNVRTRNNFNWYPMKEVAALFIGIFLAMAPALMYLKSIAPELPINSITLFVFSGTFSSLLDNAPTYVTFFEMARELGGQDLVAGIIREDYLRAISMGSVFCGSMSPIGNAPNLMIIAMAIFAGVRMPSFIGYMGYAWLIMTPILTGMAMIFLVDDPMWNAVGWGIAAVIVLGNVWIILRNPDPHHRDRRS